MCVTKRQFVAVAVPSALIGEVHRLVNSARHQMLVRWLILFM